jgi:hypothetical protein
MSLHYIVRCQPFVNKLKYSQTVDNTYLRIIKCALCFVTENQVTLVSRTKHE